MKIRDRLSYANVTATLALCVALATGGAYAQSRIGTHEIQNRAVTGPKIQKNTVRGGVHVRNRTIAGKKIRESTLDSRRFSDIGGAQESPCDPSDVTFIECAAVTLDLPMRGRALVIATGANFSDGASPANGQCEVRQDGDQALLAQFPGEAVTNNTSAIATDGFARTLVSDSLPPGPVRFSLECNEPGPEDFKVDAPTIAAIALTNGRR